MSLGGSELVAGLVLAGLVSFGGMGFLLLRLRRERRRAERAAILGDGAVLLVEDGRVLDASAEAMQLLAADESGKDALRGRSAREALGGFLHSRRDAALAALDRLEATGEAFELIAGDLSGRRFALAGRPRGGQLRLELRDATLLETGLSHAGSDIAAREHAVPGREAEALASLAASGPLLAWSRAVDGTVTWSAGRIVARQGTVEADAAAALAAARRQGEAPAGVETRAETAAGTGGRFRLEVRAGEGGDMVALEAIELPAADGGCHGIALDSAGTLEAERALARFVRTMTETFAHLNVGLAIFDKNQRLALFNPAVVDIWQADPAWLARRPTLREIIDRLRTNRRIPETADFHAWRARLTGLFQDSEAADYDEFWHLADGSDTRVLARPHPHGSLAFVFEDVTERLRLEQQYRHSIDLRRATLDRLEEGLAVFGPDGLLQFVNAAFHDIWGTDGETVRPRMHARDLVPLIGGMTVEAAVWKRLTGFVTGAESRQPWGTRLTLGTGRILSARFAGLPDGSTMAVFGDVTDSERIAQALRERNEALEAAEEMRTAVLDRISHRLRTPLHTIFGFGQLLVDSRFGSLSESQSGYANQILESARQLLAAVDDVTELAALEIDPLHDEKADLSLGETMMLTGRLLEKRATEEGVSLDISLPETELRPACEPGRIRQIVFGLANAAISGCREGGAIELGAASAGSAVVLHVSLPPRDRAASGAPPPQCPSLPFIRRLVDQAGGELEIAVDEGSGRLRMHCSFPRAADPALPAPDRAAGGD